MYLNVHEHEYSPRYKGLTVYTNVVNWVYNGCTNVVNWVYNGCTNVVNWIYNECTNVVNWIYNIHT